MPEVTVSRRAVLQGSGALVVTLVMPQVDAAPAGQLTRPLSPAQLDTYLSIAEDGTVTAFTGKIDMGQGVDVAFRQIVAEELDVAVARVRVLMGDSALTVNQGGGSGSTSVELGAQPLRYAAAEARSVLVALAAEKLKLPPAELVVTDGVVHPRDDATRRVSYGELIGGRQFDVALKWNGRYGNTLLAQGKAAPKPAGQYRIVGQPVPRAEITDIVFGIKEFLADVRLPGMVHARMIRPPRAGATPVAIDETSLRAVRGARVVREGDVLAVVADSEWDAIRAAGALRVKWSTPKAPFPGSDAVFDHIRKAPVLREGAGGEDGPASKPDTAPATAALAAAARVIEAEYEFPFQSHASLGPACAVADYRAPAFGDATVTVWTNSQKPHATAEGLAKLLKLPRDNVRAIWVSGSGSYGRNDSADAAMDAALLSRAVGRPVRVQGMRHDAVAWDPKAPASIHVARAGFDADGRVVAYSFLSKGFSSADVASNEANPSDTLAGQLTGWPDASVSRFATPADRYQFPVKLQYWQTVAQCLDRGSPLRTGNLRDPLGPQIHFASESFMDEMAAAVKADPIEFRLRHLQEARDAGVLRAVMALAKWQARPAGPREPRGAGTVSGRGVAYTRRGNTVVAVVAEVDVNLDTGRVWPRRFYVAADHGLVVNPLGLKRVLEGNVLMSTSRTLHEEVHFTPEAVTSVDWTSYRTLDMTDAPDSIDIELVNHVDLPPYGAGEPSTRTVPPAIANAFFDATGVRLRRAPFTPERVLAALAAHRKASGT